MVHGFGNVFERTLAEGEMIHVEPGGFLYKDASVSMEVVSVDLGSAGAEQGASKVKAAKDMAGRGFRGLKAARALMKDGVRVPPGKYSAGAVPPCWQKLCPPAGPPPSWP